MSKFLVQPIPMPAVYKSSQAWLHRFAILTAIFTFALLFIGGLVTSHQAGLSVPDWPTSYGWNMFTFPTKDWIGGIFFEHTHRLFASLIGLMIMVQAFAWQFNFRGWWRRALWTLLAIGALYLVVEFFQLCLEAAAIQTTAAPLMLTSLFLALSIAVLAFVVLFIVYGNRNELPANRLVSKLSWFTLLGVVIQGTLGGLTVKYYLPPAVSTAHAGLGQAVFCLTLVIAMVTNHKWNDGIVKRIEKSKIGLRVLTLATVVVIFIQLLLGAVMRHTFSGLAIPSWPLAPNGSLIPDFTSFGVAINFAHRTWALVVMLMMFITARSIFRWFPREKSLIVPMMLGMFLLGIQIMLGAITIWSKKAVTPTTLHVSCGAAILGTMVYIMIKSRHLLASKTAHASQVTHRSHALDKNLASVITE